MITVVKDAKLPVRSKDLLKTDAALLVKLVLGGLLLFLEFMKIATIVSVAAVALLEIRAMGEAIGV